MRRMWTEAERKFLRRHYHKLTAADLANRLARSTRSIYHESRLLGLHKIVRIQITGSVLERIAQLNAQGYPDQEIAEELDCERHTISRWRQKLGLPSRARSDRYRERVRATTARQCAAAGVGSLAAIRYLEFRRRAIEAGWPADLRPRAVQMLEALAERGPMTRREIADALGMAWLGSRRSLRSSDPEGSYLANLIARGLVISLGRVVRGSGRGRSCQLYSLDLAAERSWTDGVA